MAAPFPFSDVTRELIRLALYEDLAFGDVTSDAIFDQEAVTAAVFKAKEPLVVAGIEVVKEVMRQVDPEARVSFSVEDGTLISEGEFGAIRGRVRSVLRAERVMLNFLRHLSGVATITKKYVAALGADESGPRLVDTRKTTPGFREIEKYAVRCGGGHNHRYNLGSGAMIKDNHITAAGSIKLAVDKVRGHAPFLTRIEVEVSNLVELAQALDAGADAVLLDNMTTEMMAEACTIIGDRCIAEASGNITETRLPELRDIGLDIISSGAVTHSAPNVDISMKLVPDN
ncbi:MAG: nicotinate-nucleotide pyrophosphorylase (carboxylating) [Bradymonadia bacterium]|jgi:nicotinate-nucleotide pyrophosphorylase (carboxylating)